MQHATCKCSRGNRNRMIRGESEGSTAGSSADTVRPLSFTVQASRDPLGAKGEVNPWHNGGFTRVPNCGVPPVRIVASSQNPPVSCRSEVVANSPR